VGVISAVSQPFCGACIFGRRALMYTRGKFFTLPVATSGNGLRAPLRMCRRRCRIAADHSSFPSPPQAWLGRTDRYSSFREQLRGTGPHAKTPSCIPHRAVTTMNFNIGTPIRRPTMVRMSATRRRGTKRRGHSRGARENSRGRRRALRANGLALAQGGRLFDTADRFAAFRARKKTARARA